EVEAEKLPGEIGDEHAEHQEFRLGEIDDDHDAEDQGQADGDDGIDSADHQAVDHSLHEGHEALRGRCDCRDERPRLPKGGSISWLNMQLRRRSRPLRPWRDRTARPSPDPRRAIASSAAGPAY